MARVYLQSGSGWVDAVEKALRFWDGASWQGPLKIGDHLRGSDGQWHELTPAVPAMQQFFGQGGPNDNIYDADTGRRLYSLIPASYNPTIPHALGIFLHGAGQVGTNVEAVLQDGLPQEIAENGQQMKCLWGFPQLTTGGWSEYLAAITKAINYMKAYYNVDSNKIYLAGLSNGAEGVISYLITHGIEIAGYCISSPPANGATSNAAIIKDIPGFWMVGLSDTTVGVGNTSGPLAALLAQNGRISPLSKFPFGADHSRYAWNRYLFGFATAGWDFEDWLLLHSLDREDEAGNYVQRAEGSQDYFHYLEAGRIVNSLPASSAKTALLSRLVTLQTFHETGKQRILLSFGTSAYPATGNYNQITGTASGSSVVNLIDTNGNTTGVSITFDYTQWDADLPGQPGRYHGFDKGVFAECRRIYAGNTWSFSGMNDSATYRIDVMPYYKTESGTAHFGITGIIGGITKNSLDDVYNVMDYLTWETLQSSAGTIQMTLNAQYPGSSNDGGLCAIMLTEIL